MLYRNVSSSLESLKGMSTHVHFIILCTSCAKSELYLEYFVCENNNLLLYALA